MVADFFFFFFLVFLVRDCNCASSASSKLLLSWSSASCVLSWICLDDFFLMLTRSMSEGQELSARTQSQRILPSILVEL